MNPTQGIYFTLSDLPVNQSPWENPESVLGIEYERYFAQPLVGIFRNGEFEWLEKASETYGEDAGEVWVNDIFENILSGTLEETDIEDLKLYTPKMVTSLFAVKIWTIREQALQNILNVLTALK